MSSSGSTTKSKEEYQWELIGDHIPSLRDQRYNKEECNQPSLSINVTILFYL